MRRKPRFILRWHARIALATLTAIAIGLVIFGLVVKAVRPYHESSGQVRQLTQTKRQVAELDAENAAIHRRINYLKTPAGITTEARQAGYLKPGEIPFVVEGAQGAQNNLAPQPSAEPISATATGRLRWAWHKFVTH